MAAQLASTAALTTVGLVAGGPGAVVLSLAATGAGGGIGFAGGFVYGGLNGNNQFWDWENALAGGFSGGLIGAGIGMMLTPGAVAGTFTLGSGLIGAGAGGLGSLQSGESVDWASWGTSTFVGGMSGLVSGRIGVGMGALGSSIGALTITGVTSSVVGDAYSQTLMLSMGLQEGFDVGRLGASAAGGALGGVLSRIGNGVASRWLTHRTGALQGLFRADRSAWVFGVNALADGIGGAGGDALSQFYEMSVNPEQRFDYNRMLQSVVVSMASSAAGTHGMLQGMPRGTSASVNNARRIVGMDQLNSRIGRRLGYELNVTGGWTDANARTTIGRSHGDTLATMAGGGNPTRTRIDASGQMNVGPDWRGRTSQVEVGSGMFGQPSLGDLLNMSNGRRNMMGPTGDGMQMHAMHSGSESSSGGGGGGRKAGGGGPNDGTSRQSGGNSDNDLPNPRRPDAPSAPIEASSRGNRRAADSHDNRDTQPQSESVARTRVIN